MSSQPKLTLRPPPHRDFVQGYPGIPGSSERPPAHIAGTVEVRLGSKGLKAAWLRIELRKLETLPGGESWGELIGRGPLDVWSARKDDAYKSNEDKGWEVLQTADFPFQLVIPEGLPPSAKLEKQASIAYELVTSLCVRAKKGLLKKETTSSIIQNTHPIVLEKHELHSTWPVYLTPDEHEATQDDVRVRAFRPQTCYAPGDQVDVRLVVSSERVSPIKLKQVSFSVRETITFRGGVKRTFGTKNAASQKTETLASKSKSFGKKIYKGDAHTFDLACLVPRNHTLMSIQTAKHIEVSYTLRVQVDVGKKPIVIDHLPLTISSFARSVSEDVVPHIGFVPGLSTAAVPNGSGTEDNASLYSAGGAHTHALAPATTMMSPSPRPHSSYEGAFDLRRRDTVMTQGTAISGPGMAGRGVPGHMFSWGQFGAAQPFVSDVPRPMFAGPPSVYERQDLAPEENRALFHSSNRPQSAMVLGATVDPILLPPAARRADPVPEEPEPGPEPIRTQTPVLYQNHTATATATAAAAAAEAEKERLYERARQQAERNQRRLDERRAANFQSAAEEKTRLYERARAQAEQYQAGFSQGAQFPPTASSHTVPVAAAPAARPAAYPTYMTAEEEKSRLYERAKAEAEAYQHQQQASTSSSVYLPGGWPAETAAVGAPSQQQQQSSPPVVVAPTPILAQSSSPMLVSQPPTPAPATAPAPAPVPVVSRYTPEVASAIEHATPHQPAETHSYLTEAEAQSAREKERLATHFAKKAQRAAARAAAKQEPSPPPAPAVAVATLKEPPAPIRQDDPRLWRPKYDWLEDDALETEQENSNPAPPPIPPKIPLSRSGSTFLSSPVV